jgi:hypothetical protein
MLETPSARMPEAVAEAILDDVRGPQAGGILLGRFDTELRKFAVDGYEAGPFDTVHLRAVGIFRAHTGSGLQSTPEDAAAIARLFPRGPALLLLAKVLSRRECVAAGFRCADGVILQPGTSSEEFALKTAVVEKPEPHPRKSQRWLIPSAIAFGLALALWLHYSAERPDENPVAINSYSDTMDSKPAARSGASAPTGEIWPSRSGKPEHPTR